jgi:hypothetical protein
LIQQMKILGEKDNIIQDCVRFLNASILPIPIFSELGIPNEVVIWMTIFIFKQIQLNKEMRKIMPVKLSTKDYAKIIEMIVKFSILMRSGTENGLSGIFSAL